MDAARGLWVAGFVVYLIISGRLTGIISAAMSYGELKSAPKDQNKAPAPGEGDYNGLSSA